MLSAAKHPLGLCPFLSDSRSEIRLAGKNKTSSHVLMAEAHTYFVYIITNKPHGTIYVGFTNSLNRRIWEHKTGTYDGFSKRYTLKCLVCFEDFRDVRDAIAREKQVKGWARAKKVSLITQQNPLWHDIADDCYERCLTHRATAC